MTLNKKHVNVAIAAAVALVAAAGLVFLYLYNPQDISFFPRCPFYALTGYKCPGCGTLRAIHALLHLRFSEALRLNPLLLAAIPVVVGMLLSRRFATNVVVGRVVFAVIIIYWIGRNII